MFTAVIAYQVATYSGEIEISFDDENIENDCLIAKAKSQLKRQCGEVYPTAMKAFK